MPVFYIYNICKLLFVTWWVEEDDIWNAHDEACAW